MGALFSQPKTSSPSKLQNGQPKASSPSKLQNGQPKTSSPSSTQIPSDPKPKSQKPSLLSLTNTNDRDLLCPIRYIYDYLPNPPPYLTPQPISLPHILSPTTLSPPPTSQNSIPLHPHTSLPLHTGLLTFRQSKHWRANELATRDLLSLFAHDARCAQVLLSDRKSMAWLAGEQLKREVIDTYARFSIYMFGEAEEGRIELLAQSVVLIFMFDDVWEAADPDTVSSLRSDFISRFQGLPPTTSPLTPLEQRIDSIRSGLLAGDAEEGNGGAEVLQTLIDFCNHAEPPREEFCSVRDYLDYRWEDIANSFTWACCKFSIRSSISYTSPKTHTLLRRLGDQISIVNDIASYAKEASRFATGKAGAMINLVHVIMRIDRMDAESAKRMAYAWQLYTENEILRELEKLRDGGELGEEEWKFVEACLGATSGNLLTSIVISRYGGEGARVG